MWWILTWWTCGMNPENSRSCCALDFIWTSKESDFFSLSLWILGCLKQRKSIALQNSQSGMVAFIRKVMEESCSFSKLQDSVFPGPTQQPAHRLPQLLLNSRVGCISFGNRALVSRSMTNRGSWWTGIWTDPRSGGAKEKVSSISPCIPTVSGDKNRKVQIKGPKHTKQPLARESSNQNEAPPRRRATTSTEH